MGSREGLKGSGVWPLPGKEGQGQESQPGERASGLRTGTENVAAGEKARTQVFLLLLRLDQVVPMGSADILVLSPLGPGDMIPPKGTCYQVALVNLWPCLTSLARF